MEMKVCNETRKNDSMPAVWKIRDNMERWGFGRWQRLVATGSFKSLTTPTTTDPPGCHDAPNERSIFLGRAEKLFPQASKPPGPPCLPQQLQLLQRLRLFLLLHLVQLLQQHIRNALLLGDL